MTVILVHGIFNRGSVFWRMKSYLEKQGHRCFAPSLKPRDARHGIADLAQKLEVFISQNIPADEPFAIVGFSMGCIVSRYYLYQLNGYLRAKVFFAIAGPHRGSALAYFYPGQGARELRPGSALLKNLDAIDPALGGFPIFIYWTPWDFMILPPSSARWSVGIEKKIPCLLHQLMVWDRTLLGDISNRLTVIEEAAGK